MSIFLTWANIYSIGFFCKHTRSKDSSRPSIAQVLRVFTQWWPGWCSIWISLRVGRCRSDICDSFRVGINVCANLYFFSHRNRRLTLHRAPTSGGQYHWCSMLAPPSMMKLLSYLTGGLTSARTRSILDSNMNYRLAHSYRMASNIRNLVLSGRYLDPRLDRIDKQWLQY